MQIVLITGRVAEVKDNESSTILHYAIQHKMTAVQFEKILEELNEGDNQKLLQK